MSDAIAARAPAKINFGLRVVGRRGDGYHLLESVFLPLALADELTLELTSGGLEIVVEEGPPEVPRSLDNLALRAARVFLDRAGSEAGVRVALRKRVPTAAGLGGGSSDAAAVLRALGQALPGAVSSADLRALALELGADVPFFLDPRPAWVTGIGEQIAPLQGAPGLAILLVNPGVPLSTAAVFRAHAEGAGGAYAEGAGGAYAEGAKQALADADGGGHDAGTASLTPEGADPTLAPLSARPGRSRSERAQLEALLASLGSARGAGDRAVVVPNDLEPAAARLCPAVRTLREEIRQAGARVVGLSGSGPTLFGVFGDEAEARSAARALRLEAPAASWVTHSLPSPEPERSAS